MSRFRFVGGPLDGHTINHPAINDVTSPEDVETNFGTYSFIRMPPLDECNRIERGEITKETATGPFHYYERLGLDGNDLVCLDAIGNGRYAEAATAEAAPTEEMITREARFAAEADRIAEEVEAVEFTPATEIVVRYVYADLHGIAVRSEPMEMSAGSTISGAVGIDRAKEIRRFKDDTIANIRSAVLGAPTGPTLDMNRPGLVLTVQGFEWAVV